MSNADRPASPGLSIEPFRATRYSGVDLASVTSPPYDVVEPDRTLRLEAANPYNVVRLILPREIGDDDGTRNRYDEASNVWHRWFADKVLATDDEPAVWVYEQVGPAGTLVGFVGTVPVNQPSAVLPHEDVMPQPVADRAELMNAVGANLEPILLVHDPGPRKSGNGSDESQTSTVIDTLRNSPPEIEMTSDDGARHRLWPITDVATQASINADISTRQALIADGHHRFAAYQQISRSRQVAAGSAAPNSAQPAWDRGLALVVDGRSHPLRLGAIHRGVHGLDWGTAMERLGAGTSREDFDCLESALLWLHDSEAIDGASDELPSPRLVVTDGLRWAGLTVFDANTLVPRPDRSKQWRCLPTAILHEYLLPVRWQIPDHEISYHHDIAGALRAADDEGVAVLLPALTLRTVIERAAAGELLPRKSTSFGPKPRTGLLMRTFES